MGLSRCERKRDPLDPEALLYSRLSSAVRKGYEKVIVTCVVCFPSNGRHCAVDRARQRLRKSCFSCGGLSRSFWRGAGARFVTAASLQFTECGLEQAPTRGRRRHRARPVFHLPITQVAACLAQCPLCAVFPGALFRVTQYTWFQFTQRRISARTTAGKGTLWDENTARQLR
jgi:hypothetical protein